MAFQICLSNLVGKYYLKDIYSQKKIILINETCKLCFLIVYIIYIYIYTIAINDLLQYEIFQYGQPCSTENVYRFINNEIK